MKHRASLALAGVLAISLSGAAITSAASHHQQSAQPTAPTAHTIIAGWGDTGGAANIYSPRYIDVYAGDTVTWRIGGALEPHTISFGPRALLQKLGQDSMIPVPQKSGPPQMAFNPQVAFPTKSKSYAGSGYANSGILTKGQSWSLTFTKPGTYRYICLIHGPDMAGTVVVHARPAAGKVYQVQAGESQAAAQAAPDEANDAFFPRHLTIHTGDTVVWTGGFHTVTLGPDALRTKLERQLIQAGRGKNGQALLALNSQVVYPSGGSTYDGTGFVNSGLLFMRAGKNTPPQYRLTFTKPGTYEYDCLLHPGMDGTVTVLP